MTRRGRWGRALLIWILGVSFALTSSCDDGVHALYLSIRASEGVGPLSAVGVSALVGAPGDEALFKEGLSLTGRDLSSDPLIVKVEVEGYDGAERARVSVLGLELGRVVAAAQGEHRLGSEGVEELLLTAIEPDCDGDEDGYLDCARAGCCARLEAEGLAQAFGDCDDQEAAAHPFAEAPACRRCEAGCGGGDAEPEEVEPTPEVVEPTLEVIDAGDAEAQREDVCAPDCEGRECGPDGCGGSCGPGCPDGDLCVGTWTCAAGACLQDAPSVTCEALDACHEVGACDPETGLCSNPAKACGDDDACTADSCDPGLGCQSAPKDCDDGVATTLDSCDAATGACAHTPACPAGTVAVPAGAFWMGCNDSDPESPAYDDQCLSDEHPQHLVATSAFCVDETEVTVAAYAACPSGVCAAPGEGGYCSWNQAGLESHPVNCVTWHQARGYCAWTGGRLCTEAEWEKAARGGCEKNMGLCRTSTRRYPWGDEAVSCALANYSGDCVGGTAAVGTHLGRSPYGLEDMAGNVFEWVADRYQQDYYCFESAAAGGEHCGADAQWPGWPGAWEDPAGPTTGADRVRRGGSWSSPGSVLRASSRGESDPDGSYDHIGFRCCRSVTGG